MITGNRKLGGIERGKKKGRRKEKDAHLPRLLALTNRRRRKWRSIKKKWRRRRKK